MLVVFPLGVYRDRKLAPVADAVPQTSVSKLLGLEESEEGQAHMAQTNEPFTDLRINIAGFGGQGVLLLGQILAEMGMREGREVSWLPSYGPEMRSGSVHCYLCLSKERMGSPLVEHPDLLIAMNEILLRKFAGQVGPHSTILYNSTALPTGFPVIQAPVFCVPAAEIADGLGATKAANMVLLGALLELTHALPKETSFAVLKSKVRNVKLLEVDGMECIRRQLNAAGSGPIHENKRWCRASKGSAAKQTSGAQ